MQAEYSRIFELAKPYLNTRKNLIHTEIVYRFAVKLLESELGDSTVIIPAVICHDVGWIKVPEELQLKAFGPGLDPEIRRIHEVEGVKLAREILQQVNYEQKKITEILELIEGHDSRLIALSTNDKIVKDADKLYRANASEHLANSHIRGFKLNNLRKEPQNKLIGNIWAGNPNLDNI